MLVGANREGQPHGLTAVTARANRENAVLALQKTSVFEKVDPYISYKAVNNKYNYNYIYSYIYNSSYNSPAVYKSIYDFDESFGFTWTNKTVTEAEVDAMLSGLLSEQGNEVEKKISTRRPRRKRQVVETPSAIVREWIDVWNAIATPRVRKITPRLARYIEILTTRGDASGFVWTTKAFKAAVRCYEALTRAGEWQYRWPSLIDLLSRTVHQTKGPGLLRFLPQEGYDPYAVINFKDKTTAVRERAARLRAFAYTLGEDVEE